MARGACGIIRESIAIVGAGRVGSALAYHLARAGYRVDVLIARSVQSAAAATQRAGAGRPSADPAAACDADWVLVCVADRQIAPVARTLAAAGCHAGVALHVSGSMPAAELAALADRGVAVGSVHPLHTFLPRSEPVESLSGVHMVLEGEPRALTAAGSLVRALGGVPHVLTPDAKALYHAGAVVASNYVSVLAWIGSELVARAGLGDAALGALLPLMGASLDNAGEVGLPTALTGPIERGDASTIERHAQALGALPPELGVHVNALYYTCGEIAVEMAKRKGTLSGPALEAVQAALAALAPAPACEGRGPRDDDEEMDGCSG